MIIDKAVSAVDNADFTISLWVKMNELNEDAIFISGDEEDSDNDIWWKIQHDSPEDENKFQLQFDDDSDKAVVTGDTSAETDKWYHVLVRHAENDQYELFIDAESEGTTDDNGSTYKSGHKLFIGNRPRDDNPIIGHITDVRIYNRALSQPEIKALYELSRPSGTEQKEEDVPGQDEGGISRYKLNGNADDSWSDKDGTNNGAEFVTGVYGQAAEFNGSDDYIDLETNFGFGSSDSFTMTAWVKPASVSDNKVVVGRYDGSEDNLWWGFKEGEYHVVLGHAGDDVHRVQTGNPSTDEWVYMTITFNPETPETRVYINGYLIGSDDGSIDDFEDSTTIQIGARDDDLHFEGKIDDVRIYEKALTPFQVEKLYHKGAYRISRESTLQ